MHRRARQIVSLVLAVVAVNATCEAGEGCTAAVLSTGATASGAPMLWKNRDTSVLSNRVVYVDEAPFDYLCLANADADSGRSCYAGLNSEGFAIMNTVAYNLPEEGAGEMHDLEGFIMADALRTCRTVADFERYLEANLGPDLGSLANFGVIDADGNARLLEVYNHGIEVHDPLRTPERYMVVTNFARTGEPDQGAGYLRFDRASELFATLPEGAIRAEHILTTLSRDVGHTLLDHPESLSELASLDPSEGRWITTKDCINKSYTSAAVVLVGRTPGEPGSRATMWVVPGEPITAVALPLWVEAGSSPAPLSSGDEAPLWRESARIKSLARPFQIREKETYLNLTRVDNSADTGFWPTLRDAEQEIFRDTEELLAGNPTPAELEQFQDNMAAKVLAVMEAVQ